MKTILVVDDETVICQMLSDVLEDEGYRVVMASNGQEGLSCLTKTDPQLVISDLMMPILNGRELCRAMQKMPSFQSIPIILMSAAGTPASVEDCNFAYFIDKPFDLNELLTIVETLIGHAAEV